MAGGHTIGTSPETHELDERVGVARDLPCVHAKDCAVDVDVPNISTVGIIYLCSTGRADMDAAASPARTCMAHMHLCWGLVNTYEPVARGETYVHAQRFRDVTAMRAPRRPRRTGRPRLEQLVRIRRDRAAVHVPRVHTPTFRRKCSRWAVETRCIRCRNVLYTVWILCRESLRL